LNWTLELVIEIGGQPTHSWMEVRALWNAEQFATMKTSATRVHCTSFTLPSGGVITLDSSSIVTLAVDAVFRPQCTGKVDVELADITPSSDLRDPFYASTIPQCYALAATTVIAYMLVIMLFITPRTFLSGGIVVLGRRGFTNGPSGSDAGIGIGGRPWLQKVAALTVAISLTIATANTFRVAQTQYDIGFMDAFALQTQVLNGLELKIIRVISDTFLWLAQAQTLIRLFPRQREKIIIKWTAFALISLNLIFGVLNNFVYSPNNPARPYNIVEAIPAVSYLFHLALGLLYGAWVVYYGLTKKTYAFYHPRMRNICLVALISIVSVIVPVVFFVLDISKPDVAGWGDYVRWVGAAAASVVVWEWVERIEALERNDKKDGVLGREVFDGDEMLEISPSSGVYETRRPPRHGEQGNGGGFATGAAGTTWPAMNRYRPRATVGHVCRERSVEGLQRSHTYAGFTNSQLRMWPMRPPPAVTPVSRADTGSAESTVYAVRYHPIGENTEPLQENQMHQGTSRRNSFDIEAQPEPSASETTESEKDSTAKNSASLLSGPEKQQTSRWEMFHKWNPFRKKLHDLPREVSRHTSKEPPLPRTNPSLHKRDVLGRLEDFAAVQAEKLREKTRPTHDSSSLPVTRIPAPPRRHNLQEIMEEIDDAESPQGSNNVSTPAGRNPAARTSSAHVSGSAPSPRPRESQPSGDSSPDIMADNGDVVMLAAVQQDWERRMRELSHALLAVDGQSTSPAPQSSQFQHGASPNIQNTEFPRLPVVRIPAPRRTRSDG
jgi:hypothetical protein